MSVESVDQGTNERTRTDAIAAGTGRVLGSLKRSFALQLAVGGLAMIVVAFVLNTGVWAAVLAVWGGALVVIGLSSYAFARWALRGNRG